MIKLSNPSDFKDKNRKKLHQLPSGLVVELHRLDPLEMLTSLGFISQDELNHLGSMNGVRRQSVIDRLEIALNEFNSSKNKQLEALDYLLTAGISRPKVTNKLLSDVAEDEIHISDLGDDLDDVIKAIMEFSGFENPEALMVSN